jgi:ATP-binding protein involved in chromosome partitioning
MKYAVPIADGKISDHFGHCSNFALYDIDEATATIIKKEIETAPEHQPGVLPQWLSSKGVSVVIARGMGSRAQAIFDENDIKVIIGATTDNPEEAIKDYLNGTLQSSNNICDH